MQWSKILQTLLCVQPHISWLLPWWPCPSDYTDLDPEKLHAHEKSHNAMRRKRVLILRSEFLQFWEESLFYRTKSTITKSLFSYIIPMSMLWYCKTFHISNIKQFTKLLYFGPMGRSQLQNYKIQSQQYIN